MRSNLVNFPNLSYLKIQPPVAPSDKFSSVTVKKTLKWKGIFQGLGEVVYWLGKKLEFLFNNANFQFSKRLVWSITNSLGCFHSRKNKEKLLTGGNHYQLMKKALKAYVPVLCCAILYYIIHGSQMKTDQLSSQSCEDAFQASRMYVLHYYIEYGRVGM